MTEESSPSKDTHRADAVPLSQNIGRALSYQAYGESPRIVGVDLFPLRKNRGENGWFMELHRLSGGRIPVGEEVDFELRQLSAAYAEPGRINAFHIHPKTRQDELWTVVQGGLSVWLIDCRLGSPTEGVRKNVLLSAEAPTRLHIPAGVAHGYRAGREGALLIYGMNRQFDREDPNEGRLPWDFFGEELWESDRG